MYAVARDRAAWQAQIDLMRFPLKAPRTELLPCDNACSTVRGSGIASAGSLATPRFIISPTPLSCVGLLLEAWPVAHRCRRYSSLRVGPQWGSSWRSSVRTTPQAMSR